MEWDYVLLIYYYGKCGDKCGVCVIFEKMCVVGIDLSVYVYNK